MTESACRSLNNGDANELRAKVVNVLKWNNKVKEQNVNKEEWEAIDEMRNDDSIIILSSDKGRVTVVMNKTDYTQKCKLLLDADKTYQMFHTDPNLRFKKQLVGVLKELKDRNIISDKLHRTI